MTKEYAAMREGFEDHIAKQQKLEGIPKAVLAVQLFAMNENLDYIDGKLQTKWVEWRSACSQQIKKDAGMCRTRRKRYIHESKEKAMGAEHCEYAIRNQATRSEDQENE